MDLRDIRAEGYGIPFFFEDYRRKRARAVGANEVQSEFKSRSNR